MTLFVGLDGGGSGCRARAARDKGAPGPVFEGGSANVHTDPTAAAQRIADLLARVLQAEGHDAATSPDPHIVLGLAGASESGAAARLSAALPYRNLTVLGDIDIALSGAFGARDGIVMAVGTGSVLARQTNGRMQRVGGYGLALGDEGWRRVAGAARPWRGAARPRRAASRCTAGADGLGTLRNTVRAAGLCQGGPAG